MEASEPIQVRRIAASDWKLLRRARLRGLETDPSAFGSTAAEAAARLEDFWRDWAAGHSGGADACTLLALGGPEPVGLVRCQRDPVRPQVFGLYSMWVAPEVRRRGVGLRLLATAERWVAAAGGEAIELNVMADEGPARALYERAGYRLDGRREPAPGGDELGMRRELCLVSP